MGAIPAATSSVAAPMSNEIEAPGPRGPLEGTSLEPTGGRNAPVVLIIPGSGPTDRDGNSPAGLRAAPYRLLAEALAARDIASVRIDKRGMFASAGAVPDANAVTIGDYVDDTRRWIAAIRARTGAKCVWLLGHSEGGLVALAAADALKDICGVIAVATPGRRAGEVLRAQLRASTGDAVLLEQADAAIAKLEAGQVVDAARLAPPLQVLFPAAVQGFLSSEFRLDPSALAGRLAVPLLIVQGDADLQVSVEDARRLKAAQPSAVLSILTGVNHVLKQAPRADRRANVATYADPSLPLAPEVAEVVADFIESRR